MKINHEYKFSGKIKLKLGKSQRGFSEPQKTESFPRKPEVS